MRLRQKSEPGRKLKALFFCSDKAQTNDNYQRLPRAFEQANWEVEVESPSTLSIANLEIISGNSSINEFDLIWPIGFGERGNFLDRIQILSLCPQEKLITSPSSWLLLHGKASWLKHCPLSFVSSEAEVLIDFMKQHGGQWVLKPNAGSYGRDLSFIQDEKQGTKQILESCSASDDFFILQRFQPEIQDGELRCLCVDGTIIGQYLKVPKDDIRSNIFSGASIKKATISKEQEETIQAISQDLASHKVGFAAIDMVGSTLMEVNIANPGGLESLETLYNHDFSINIASTISERFT